MLNPPEVLKPIRRVFIVAGESSADIHAANLVRLCGERHPHIRFEGFGGPQMAEAGCRLHENIVHLASMGVSWIENISAFLRLLRRVYKIIVEERPDAVLLVDMPGFNFLVARIARWKGVPVVYYICPQIWAWAPWRRKKILRLTQLQMVILPFEEDFYRSEGHRVVYVGHPLADSLIDRPPPSELARDLRARFEIRDQRKIIALFPGSRTHEVEQLLPFYRSTIEKMELDPAGHRVMVSCHRAEFRERIESIFEGSELPVDVVEGDAHPLMAACDLALVASGTATLELAYYAKPMLVLYRISRLHHAVFRRICTSPYIALVNILGGEEVVPEEITYRDTSAERARIAVELLRDGPRREACIEKLVALRERCFQPGASGKAADTLAEFFETLEPAARPS